MIIVNLLERLYFRRDKLNYLFDGCHGNVLEIAL